MRVLFSKSKKKRSVAYRERTYSLNTLPTMIHGRAFRVITWQSGREGSPYPQLGYALGSSMDSTGFRSRRLYHLWGSSQKHMTVSRILYTYTGDPLNFDALGYSLPSLYVNLALSMGVRHVKFYKDRRYLMFYVILCFHNFQCRSYTLHNVHFTMNPPLKFALTFCTSWRSCQCHT